MKNKLLIAIGFLTHLLISNEALPQSVISRSLPSTSLNVNSYYTASEIVDSVVLEGSNWKTTWKNAQIMEQEDCHLVGELVGTCAILDLPLIGSIEPIDSNVVILFGSNRSGALQDRQFIVLDRHTGVILGWYGYITWRANDVCKIFIDLDRRTLLIGARENDMLEDCLYVVNREQMTMDVLHAETSAVKAIEISLLGDYRPNVVRSGYFQVRF